MPFTIQVTGLEEVLRKMEKLPETADKVAAEALYEGAGVMADAVSQAVQGIATEPFRYAAGGRKREPSPEEKAAVASAKHGIAKFRHTGTEVQTSIGFQNAGYANVNGKTKPIALIANSINSGTSFMERQPFLRKTFHTKKRAAEAAIEAGIAKRESEFDLG